MKIDRSLMPILGAGALVGALVMSSTASVDASPTPGLVTVTNTPLPVSGTVGVTQAGTWTVGFDGVPAVQVKPPQRFEVTLQGYYGAWLNTTDNTFVVDYMNAFQCTDPSGQVKLTWGDGAEFSLNREYVAEYNGDTNQHHDNVKFYVGPGSTIYNPHWCFVTLTGHMEPGPTTTVLQ